jgi:hypothetical protein
MPLDGETIFYRENTSGRHSGESRKPVVRTDGVLLIGKHRQGLRVEEVIVPEAPSWAMCALVNVSRLVKVLDEMMSSVSSASITWVEKSCNLYSTA